MRQERFDLSRLDDENRPAVEAATKRLHELERRTGESIIEIGRTLLEIKGRLGHGRFGEWLEAEFGWSVSAASKFMQAAEAFGDKSVNFTNMAPSALYALASGNVPVEVREEFVAKAEAGERVTNRAVKQRLAVVDLDSGEIVRPGNAEPEVLDHLPAPSPSRRHSVSLPTMSSKQAFMQETENAVRGASPDALNALHRSTIEALAPSVLSHNLAKVAEATAKARFVMSTIKDKDRLRTVVENDAEMQEQIQGALEDINVVSGELRFALGSNGPDLRRVS